MNKNSNQEKGANFSPPPSLSRLVVQDIHGFKITDPYQWLEDKQDVEVQKWTQTQHQATLDYAEANYKPISGLKEEIQAFIDRDMSSPLSLVGKRQFFTRRKKGEKQSKLYTLLEGEEKLLFDPEKIDPSGTSSLSGLSYTRQGEKVAIGIQNKGAEIQTYYILDTENAEILGPPIKGLRGFSWTKDEKHAYITVRTQEMIDRQEPYQILKHRLGRPRNEDRFLLSPKNAQNIAGIYDSRYSEYTFSSEGDFYSTQSLKMKKIEEEGLGQEIYASTEFQASPQAIGENIYFYTNHEAPNFKLMRAKVKQPNFEHWEELYPEKESILEGYTVSPSYLLIQDKKDILSRLMLYTLEGQFIKELALPEIANVSYLSYNQDVDAIFVGLSTFTSPGKIYRLDPDQLESEHLNWEIFYESEKGIETENIEAKIEFFPSKDGVKVPLFIMHRKGITLDESNPTLLYGYGGFNIGISPSFVGLNAAFINRGGVYAVAGIRGGNEYGESWHRAGMMHKKQNSFDDFIAAAEYLIKEKYTSSTKLAIRGGSNGGLLVGAVMTQRPDLFKTVLCQVPLLDMIRFHKFLIARYWIPEYGDPDKWEDFQNILSYSPYHQVRRGLNMPTSLISAGENDTRVDPLHAKKFVAQLQNNLGQINPIMLYMDFDSGHGSGKSTEQLIEQQAFIWTFLMNELEMK